MMAQSLRIWWDRLPVSDVVQRRQAGFFQAVLVGWIALATIGMPLNFLRGFTLQQAPMPAIESLPPVIFALIWLLTFAGLMLWLAPVIALAMLRRGRFQGAVLMAVWGLLFAHTIATYSLGVGDASVYVVYQIPIALAGLLGGRRMLLAVSSYSIALVLLVGFLQSMAVPQAGFFSAAAMAAAMGAPTIAPDLVQPVAFFIVVTLLLSLMLDRFGAALRGALGQALTREAELERARGSLEAAVGERTAELEAALRDIRRQTDEQARLIDENAQQRDFIREMSVPVLPVSGDTLVMPLVGALDSSRLAQVQEQALGRLEVTRARRLLLDITGVPVVDTQVAQGLIRVVMAGRMLGAQVVLVGIRPEVAQSIVGLGIDLSGIRTYSSLQSALGNPA